MATTAQRKRPRAAGGDAAASPADAQVFLLSGTDAYTIREQARALIARILPEAERALGLEEIAPAGEGADAAVAALRECLLSVTTGNVFSPRKLTWLRDAAFLKDRRIGAVEEVKDWVDRLTAQIKAGIPEGHFLLITTPGVDGRSALARACAARGLAEAHDLVSEPWKQDAAAQTAAGRAFAHFGLAPGPGALECFAQRVGADPGAAMQEAEKLSVYLGGGRTATALAVEAIVSAPREADFFTLTDRIAERNLPAALSTLRRLTEQSESPIGMIAILENRWRQMALLRDAEARGWLEKRGKTAEWRDLADAAEVLDAIGPSWDPRRIHPFRLGAMLEQARNYSPAELARGAVEIARVRERMVSGFPLQDLLMEVLVIRLTRPAGRPRRSAS
jgi:DNA polymerase III delta subunit